jgi:hypothetical protein
MDIHFMLILSPHRVSERGKVVNLDFVSIFSQNLRRLILLKNKCTGFYLYYNAITMY